MMKLEERPFQRRVAELILEGKSVILQAPTGAGKTWAALWPFFDSLEYGHTFPRKAIYSVPMRTLANQFEHSYRELLTASGRQHDITMNIQTGARPDDPKFESNLLFTTIDQTLSSFLHIPYSLSHRQANLNAGAVASSYLVFDELHLFSPDDMLPTTLMMLTMLKGLTPFVLMTATFSRNMLKGLAKELDAIIVPDPDVIDKDGIDEVTAMQRLSNLKDKERVFYGYDAPLTADEVLSKRGTRTLCICNTVARAQQLYAELLEQIDPRSVGLTLLHSRFFKSDRAGKEEDVRTAFEPSIEEYNGKPHILVSTQVVEVGMDITSDVLLTETAPAATLIQRAGRCARRGAEKGTVHIYRPKREKDGPTSEPDYTPYYIRRGNKADARLSKGYRTCEATWEAIAGGEFTGRPLTWEDEQEFVNRAHAEVDEQILAELSSSRTVHLGEMLKAMQDQAYGLASSLIRSSDNARFSIICPYPENDEHLSRNPFHYEGLSVSPGMLSRNWKQLLEEAGDDHGLGPLGWRAVAIDDSDHTQHDRYRWDSIENPGDVFGAGVALALNPAFAAYDAEIGLHFALDTQPDPPALTPRQRHKPPDYTNHLETYREHITGLMRAYEKSLWLKDLDIEAAPLRDEIAYTAGKLQDYCGISASTFDRMIRVVIATHDLGKLDAIWQEWAHNWQAARGKPIEPDYRAAHTDYDSGDDEQKKLQNSIRPKRPHHAGESAWAAAPVIYAISQQDERLARAALSAICRHHTPGVDSCSPYRLKTDALTEAEDVLNSLCAPVGAGICGSNQKNQEMKKCIVRFDTQHCQEVILYALLVRVLRLADQRSQQ